MFKTTPRLEIGWTTGNCNLAILTCEMDTQVLSGGLSGIEKEETIGFGKIWALTQTLRITCGILSKLQNLSVLLYF